VKRNIPPPPLCPKCEKSDMVIPIVYGYPGPILFKSAEEGRVKLGGCFVATKHPKWWCKRDLLEF
jgi:hypothetical protein